MEAIFPFFPLLLTLAMTKYVILPPCVGSLDCVAGTAGGVDVALRPILKFFVSGHHITDTDAEELTISVLFSRLVTSMVDDCGSVKGPGQGEETLHSTVVMSSVMIDNCTEEAVSFQHEKSINGIAFGQRKKGRFAFYAG